MRPAYAAIAHTGRWARILATRSTAALGSTSLHEAPAALKRWQALWMEFHPEASMKVTLDRSISMSVPPRAAMNAAASPIPGAENRSIAPQKVTRQEPAQQTEVIESSSS